MFTLDPQLEKDCIDLGDLPLSKVLLMNDRQYPWIILVPRVAGVTEIFQLSEMEQHQLNKESAALAKWMAAYFKAEKMNIAALGNVVSQLHVHHIARFKKDLAWPKPVWGVTAATAYGEEQMHSLALSVCEEIRKFEGAFEPKFS